MQPASTWSGYAQVVLGSVLFGLIGIFVKLVHGMPAGAIIFYRLLFAVAILVAYLSFRGRLGELSLAKKKAHVVLLGLVQAAAMFCYFAAIRHTTVSVAVLLLYTAPVHVTLLSPWLLEERIGRRSLIALAVAIGGLVLVIRPDTGFRGLGGTDLFGVLLGLMAGLLYALMIVTSRHLGRYYSGTAQMCWATAITMIVFAPWAGAVSSGVLLDNLPCLVLFGLLPTAIGGMLYLGGLRHVSAQNASIIGLLEPIGTVSFAFLILGESLAWRTLLGGGLIMLAALIVSTGAPAPAAPCAAMRNAPDGRR